MTRHIAVFDDDARYFRYVERALHLQDYSCILVTTPNTDEAARIIANEGCDAALVDIYMYGQPLGFECITKLRAYENGAEMPVIITSGAPHARRDAIPYLNTTTCDLLLKPFGPDELLARLATIFAEPSPALTSAPLFTLPQAFAATDTQPAISVR